MFGRRAFLGCLIPGAVGLAVLAALTGSMFVDYLVELKWFNSLGYQFYFWQRLLWRYVVFSSIALLFFLHTASLSQIRNGDKDPGVEEAHHDPGGALVMEQLLEQAYTRLEEWMNEK